MLSGNYKEQQAAVRADSELTDWFGIGKGVQQGCLVSPMSFNCYSEQVMQELTNELHFKRTVNNLRYADVIDIALIATSPAALQQLIDKINAVSREYGLEISIQKTKVMVVSKEKITVHITCNGTHLELEQVDSFRYLGAIVCESGECSTEIRARLGMARSTIKSLECFWKSRSLSLEIKKRLVEALVWPVAMYGSESWTLKAAQIGGG